MSKCEECEETKDVFTCQYTGKDHEHILCEDCGKQCDNCKEWFCHAYKRKLGMEVCEECMLYNG